jgi:hypothetical protein
MDSLKITDAASAAVATHPRVTLADIETAISAEYVFTAAAALQALGMPDSAQVGSPTSLLTICLIVMQNGFTVVGKSAPASPENFNADLGKKFAREDAIRQIWPLMGFALRDRLAQG